MIQGVVLSHLLIITTTTCLLSGKKSFIIKLTYIIYNVDKSENKIKTKRLTQHSNVIDEHHSDTSEEDCGVVILMVTRHVTFSLCYYI